MASAAEEKKVRTVQPTVVSIAPDVARQYLKAMGIESWESRSASAPVSHAVNTAAPQHSWQGATQYSPDSFVSSLAVAAVDDANVSPAQLLVVLESPVLSTESQTLLASMLKAINIDLSSQAVVNLTSEGTESVQAIAGRVNPQMILCMARFQKDLAELALLRDRLHRGSWTQALVALTLHPALLLTQPDLKRPAWEDLKRVRAALDG